MVYWPVQNIVVWGFFTLYLSRDNHLQPGLVTCLLSATILWGMFYAFQRDLTTCVLEELWSRNLLNLLATPLDISEYMTGLVLVNLCRALTGMTAAALIAWLCYAYNLFPYAIKLLPFMFDRNFRSCRRRVYHRPYHPLQHADSDAGMELCRTADALFVCAVSYRLTAPLPANYRLGVTDDTCLRGYARGNSYRKDIAGSVQNSAGPGCGLSTLRDSDLAMDVEVRTHARSAGKVDMTGAAFVRARGSRHRAPW